MTENIENTDVFSHWKKFLTTSLALLTFLFFAVGFSYITSEANEEELLEEGEQVGEYDVFEDISLQAEAVYVWDVSNRQMVYGRNVEKVLPLASLSKIMTALVAYEALTGDTVQVDIADLSTEGDSGLLGYETWNVDDLVDFMLIVSSNDGAASLASAFEAQNGGSFVDAMNRKARVLGLPRMYFTNPSGLDSEDLSESGGYGSVRDTVLLFEHVLTTYPHLLEATRERELTFISESAIVHEAENTNQLVDDIPFLIASKTGFTDLAGGNLVVAFNTGLGSPYIIGVLGSTLDGRFSDIKKLHDATIEYVHLRNN